MTPQKCRKLCFLQITTKNIFFQFLPSVPSVPGWSGLATIAELMGLVRLSSFPWAGSIDMACNIPAPTAHPSLWPSRTYPPRHTPVGPLALFISYLSLCRPRNSFFHSFAISSCVHFWVARCTLSHLPHLWCQFLSDCTLYLLLLLLYLYLFFSSFHSLIFHCFLPSFPVYSASFYPNPPMFFIGAVCNSLPAHFLQFRCSTAFKYNTESVKQKHYRT